MNTIKPGVLTVFTYSGFAPVCAVDDDGTPWGTDISFLKKFADAHNLKIEWTVRPQFEGIWLTPGQGEQGLCDIAAAGITQTDKRTIDAGPKVVWSEIYFHVQRSLLIRASDAQTFTSIESFTSKNTIAVTKDSTADEDIQMRNPKGAMVNRSYTVQDKAVQALLHPDHYIDAFAEGDVSNEYLAARHPGQLLVIDRHDMIKGKSEPFSLPVRKASGILELLNEWIKKQHEEDYPKIKHV